MNLDFTPEDILVADRSLFPYVYGLKETHPEFCFKLLDEDQLIHLASFEFALDPIPELIVRGFSYPAAKRYSLLLRLGLGKKNEDAKRFLESLGQEAIVRDPLGKFELGAGRIYFLEKKDDIELHRLLREEGFAPIDIGFADLGAEIPAPTWTPEVFKNKFAQFCHIFASIREKLLSDSSYAKKCYIQIKDFSDVFYAREIGRMFGVETYYRYNAPLLSEPEYTRLYQALRNRGSLSLSEEEKETEEGKVTQALIEQYRLLEIEPPFALTRLYEILSSRFQKRQIGEKGILLSDSFSVSGRKEIYLTCFQDGTFYKCFADDDIFDDVAFVSMGFNPSYVKTALEKRKKALYLLLNRFSLVSRVKEHLDEKINDSPFQKEFGKELIPHEKVETIGVFTAAAGSLVRGALLDESHYPKPLDDLKSYDSTFKGIEGYQPPKKKNYSVTNLESYIRCPYAYYLKTVLPSTSFNHDSQYLGVLVHRVLESIDKEDFDYDAVFQEGIEAYVAEMKKYEEVPGPREEVIFDVTKANLKRYVVLLRSRRTHSKLLRSYAEKKLSWTLKEGEKTYSFYGVADFIGVYQNGPLTYFTITDYKSGSEEFLPYGCFLGASTQLPLYAYALTKGEQKGTIEGAFAGMGMQNLFPGSLKTAFCKNGVFSAKQGYETVRIHGVYLNDESFWASFDDTYTPSKKGNVGGSYAYAGKKTFDSTGAGNLSAIDQGRPYSLDELIDDAVKGTLKTIHDIEAGKFDIAPSPQDPRDKPEADKLRCSRCPYSDICYHDTLRDAVTFKTEVERHFKGHNGDGSDGI